MSIVSPQALSDGARAGAFTPIADYGLLADCNSAALCSRAGSIDWLCLPRYDSDALFSRILDPEAGHWAIRPAGAFETGRRYLPGTLAIETSTSRVTAVPRSTACGPTPARCSRASS